MTSPPLRWWLPGPSAVPACALAAMQRPALDHRGAEAEALHGRLQDGLRSLFRTRRPVALAACSATGLMEGAIRSAVRERVLCVVSGHFGERFAQVAERCDREVIRLHVPPGEALEPELLAAMLDGPPVDAVTLVHGETATGVQQPVAELLRLLRPLGDVVTIVDAVTTLGATDVDPERWGADVVIGTTQKALAAPAGLAFASVSDRLLVRAATIPDRGRYLDLATLHEHALAGRFPQTPPLPQCLALDVQLARIAAEGLEARWARHRAMREAVERWVAARDGRIGFLPPPGRRADAVSALRLPPGRSARALVAALAADGWTIGTTRDDPDDRIIRIGHMGEATPADLALLLDALDTRLPP